ncbi:MAG: tetratricopeptide repeat protein [Deltaproteobacteria bacterium]|nr:MAG: tetratricopeptide repeat protein [Deltaproteobacteria bacterium]
MTWWCLWLLLACQSAEDRELAPVRAALDAWRDGVEALEQGDVEGARIAFQDARRHQPRDPLLLAWEARANAELGDLEEAVELLDKALLLDPSFAIARYNRAAYLARMGRPELAGPELEAALLAGVRTPREAAADPDFEPFLGLDAFGFLPGSVLSSLGIQAPGAPVFEGSEFTITVRIAGAGTRPIGVTAERLEGPAVLTGARETLLDSTDGLVREIEWTWRGLGPGTMVIGPVIARVDERSLSLEAAEVEILAAPDAAVITVEHEARIPTPLEFGLGDRPRALDASGDLVVTIDIGDKVVVEPKPEGQPQAFVYAIRDVPQYRAYRWPGAMDQARRVRITRRGTEVLATTITPEP